MTFGELQDQAHRAANALRRLGVQRGDRVAIVMPQRFETAVAHMAIHQLGAIAMPLSMLFGPEALEYRLNDSQARVAIVDEGAIEPLLAARAACPGLETVITAGDAAGRGDIDWNAALAAEPPRFEPVVTAADDPAVLIYTSGTTGPPKGALIPHRALIGNLSGFVCSQNWFGLHPQSSRVAPASRSGAQRASARVRPSSLGKREREKGGVTSGASARSAGGTQAQSVFWSPADWAWTGGLMDALLPSLYFGRPILAYQGRVSPARAVGLMQRPGVTPTFLFPTAL